MNKIKHILSIIFLIITISLTTLSVSNIKPINTDIVQGFLTNNSSKNNNDLLKLSKRASNKVNVLFETTDYYENEDLKADFISNLKTDKFMIDNLEFTSILNLYKENPHNFLSPHKRILLLNKNYKYVDREALEDLYNPMGVMLETPDKDPYLLLSDYIKSFNGVQYIPTNEIVTYQGKFYSKLSLRLTSDEKDVKDLIKLKRELTKDNDGQIYLTGPLIHSYTTSSKSVLEINLICFASILALICLCKFYFKSLKILIPIGLSIFFGIGMGYVITNLIFDSINVLTFVFSTTLIGISLDYSLHYYITKREKTFYKSLTNSMLTTVLAFFTLFITNIQLLKEIAIFTGFGLISVYLFVILILPYFKLEISKNSTLPIPSFAKYKKYILIFIGIVFAVSLFKIKFTDNIKSLYVPEKNLLKAEILYKKIFNTVDRSFILVHGDNVEDLITKEENITEKLDDNDISYVCLSKIIPSQTKQKESQKLIKTLYAENLDSFADFIDLDTKNKLKNSFKDDKLIKLDFNKYSYLSNFLLDENTSFIIIPAEYELGSEYNQINITKDISSIVKNCRKNCQIILPIIAIIITAFLVINYGLKKAISIMLSPFLGIIFAISMLAIFNTNLNIFNILALFLILGFSLDYSIFRASGDDNSKDAVFMSCISTVFSFLLLSMTSFSLISSMGTVLCIGIFTAYVLSLTLIDKNN